MNTCTTVKDILTPQITILGIADSHIPSDSIIMPRQTHSVNIRELGAEELLSIRNGDRKAEEIFADTDALITRLPDVAIGVRTADCVPILLHAADIAAVAAVHAGWKGTLGDIAGATVSRLIDMGANPDSIHAYIGPCICADCYEVSPELAAEFAEAGLAEGVSVPGEGGRPHIDLRACNRLRLISAGVARNHIELSGQCTRHSQCSGNEDGNPNYRYYSYRRTPGETRRNISCIYLSGGH